MTGTTLQSLLSAAINNGLNGIHTCLPGTVISYDFSIQRATVRPSIKRQYKDGRVDAMPDIVSVPLMWPRAGGASLTFPVRPGDGVLLVFSERALEDWLTKGGQQPPGDPRKFDLTDAIAIPGLNPFTIPSLAENNDDVHLVYGGASVTIKPDGQTIITSGAATYDLRANGDVHVSAQNVYYDCQLMRISGDLQVGDDIIDRWSEGNLTSAYAYRLIYKTHTHDETESITGVPNQQYP
jgi:hypothetical protein